MSHHDDDKEIHEKHHEKGMHGEHHGHEMHGMHDGHDMHGTHHGQGMPGMPPGHDPHGGHHGGGGRRSGCLTKQYMDMVTGKTVIARVYGMFQQMYEPQGYYLNKDRDQCFEIIGGGMANKKQYGYMACPCREVSGVRDQDKDIICPCDYMNADVEEYGTCYCNLFVSKEWNEEKIPHVKVPERRSPQKLSA